MTHFSRVIYQINVRFLLMLININITFSLDRLAVKLRSDCGVNSRCFEGLLSWMMHDFIALVALIRTEILQVSIIEAILATWI